MPADEPLGVMSLAERAMWCVACGGIPTVTVTVERNGVLAHYGSCDDCIVVVAERVRHARLIDGRLAWPPPVSPPATNVDQDADPGLFSYYHTGRD